VWCFPSDQEGERGVGKEGVRTTASVDWKFHIPEADGTQRALSVARGETNRRDRWHYRGGEETFWEESGTLRGG